MNRCDFEKIECSTTSLVPLITLKLSHILNHKVYLLVRDATAIEDRGLWQYVMQEQDVDP